jgi:cysteinyl-tRNA synthetase, unknown class
MLKFKTSTGTVAVDNWGYQLQGLNGDPQNVNLLISATHDLLVIDSSRDGTNSGRFTTSDVARMKDGMGGRSVVVSYISIGEASDFRDY